MADFESLLRLPGERLQAEETTVALNSNGNDEADSSSLSSPASSSSFPPPRSGSCVCMAADPQHPNGLLILFGGELVQSSPREEEREQQNSEASKRGKVMSQKKSKKGKKGNSNRTETTGAAAAGSVMVRREGLRTGTVTTVQETPERYLSDTWVFSVQDRTWISLFDGDGDGGGDEVAVDEVADVDTRSVSSDLPATLLSETRSAREVRAAIADLPAKDQVERLMEKVEELFAAQQSLQDRQREQKRIQREAALSSLEKLERSGHSAVLYRAQDGSFQLVVFGGKSR
jgi:hypothetical protein